MAKSKRVEPPALEILEDRPIVISGQPGNLRGVLYLSNRSNQHIVAPLAQLRLGGEPRADLPSTAASQGPQIRLSPRIIRPGHSGSVRLSLSLDPYTPPGEYQTQAEISGQLRPVVVHVTEKVDLRISPSQLVIENQPGSRSQKRVILENRGNVSLQIGEFGVVYLDDDLLTCRTLRAAAAAVDDDLRSLDEYLATILLSAKHVAESSGILRIHNKTGKFELSPGEVHPVDLEVRVPETLDKRGRYRGILALHTANLTFVIVPGSGPPPPEEKGKIARRAPAGATARGKKE